MAEVAITLTDDEWADALGVAFRAAHHARFVEGREADADQIGVEAGRARVREIALARARRGVI